MSNRTLFCPLNISVDTSQPLNNPHSYTPSEAVLAAQSRVVAHVEELCVGDDKIRAEFSQGKMLGVLVVQNSVGELGYIAGFSGSIVGQLELDGFVPPIFGRSSNCKEYAEQDRVIVALSREIDLMEQSEELSQLKSGHEALLQEVESERAALARDYAVKKQLRDAERATGVRSVVELQRESQHQKGEIRRREREMKQIVEESQQNIYIYCARVKELKDRRREMSFELQWKMFESYKLLNGLGELRSLYSIFEESIGRLPPSGAGECAAPKMLHYAFANGMKPLSIGEFWYGESPRCEVRHHLHFYGACKSRCEPILAYMLQGVEVESCEQNDLPSLRSQLEVVFEDQYLVLFNKPSGMLSVQGLSAAESVASIARELYPEATGAMMVHRLDQDTSGLLLVAKSAEVHKKLQRQFLERTLKKRYVAVVEGCVPNDSGEITLPLMPNVEDRPRQMVSREHGKAALTTYEVVSRDAKTTRLSLIPHTGRTHQLRVHCAHRDGLGAPIAGDRLYGRANGRLLLHAEQITFRHPITGEELSFSFPAQF